MATPAEIILDQLHGDDYPNWRESESARSMIRKVDQALEKIPTGCMPIDSTATEVPAAATGPAIGADLVLPAEIGQLRLFATGAVVLPAGKLRGLARTGLLRHAGKGRYVLTVIGERVLA